MTSFRAACLLLPLWVACSSSSELPDAEPEGGRDSGMPTPPHDAGGPDFELPDLGPRAPVVCGGVACAPGMLCCFNSLRCFDPSVEGCALGDVDAGPPMGLSTRRDGPAPPCASDGDCWADEFCNGTACGGPGICQPRDNCGSCNPPGGICQVCGCDGVTYPAPQYACALGVRVSGYVSGGTACGATPPSAPLRVPCGSDAECPSGASCCGYYGFCMPTDCTYCCAPPPPGATLPCTTNDECMPGEYCAGDGCGTVGGCVRTGDMSECSGALDEVCGCDGNSYTNECWANAARARVASHGRCS